MEKLLVGKTAIITGASSGIGKASALLLAKHGANVIITARNENNLQKVKAEIDQFSNCEYIVADGSDISNCDKIVAFALEKFNKVDILVCNAGMALRDPTLQMKEEDFNKVMQVNLTYPTFLSQRAIKEMLTTGGGKIVMISSTAGKNLNMGASPSYGASKAGMLYLTRHLATEFAQNKIYCNAICPGPIDTEITKTWTEENRAKVMANLPLGRLGTPEDIANLVLFLSSSLSNYINGESILANGGRFME